MSRLAGRERAGWVPPARAGIPGWFGVALVLGRGAYWPRGLFAGAQHPRSAALVSTPMGYILTPAITTGWYCVCLIVYGFQVDETESLPIRGESNTGLRRGAFVGRAGGARTRDQRIMSP